MAFLFSKEMFNPIILVVLLGVGAYTLARPSMGQLQRLRFGSVRPRRHLAAAMLIGLGIGVLGTIVANFATAIPATLAHLTPWGYYALATAADYEGGVLVVRTPSYPSIAVLGVVGAVEGEVAQRGELALDPVQPGGVARGEHQLDVMGRAPVADLVFLVWREVVAHDIQPPGREPDPQLPQEGEELPPALAVADLGGAVGAHRVEPIAIERVASPQAILEARQRITELYVDERIVDYIVDIVHATREPASAGLADLKPLVEFGASPRATIALAQASRAHAFLRGRNFVTPDDVKGVAPDVLRHRVLTTYEAEAEEVTSDEIVRRILATVEAP